MTHYIAQNGKFQSAVYHLLKNGFSISWYDRWADQLETQVSVINKDILDNWLKITDDTDKELINKLTQTINRRAVAPIDETIIPKKISPLPTSKGTGTRTKFTCSDCGLNAWAKPNANIVCGNCKKIMMSY